MNEKEFKGPSFKTIVQIGALVFLVTLAIKSLASGFFSYAVFAGDPTYMQDASGKPIGFLPGLFDIVFFCFLMVMMSVFGLWPMLGKFVKWVQNTVTDTVKSIAPGQVGGKSLDPAKVRNLFERLNEQVKAVSDRIDDVEHHYRELLDFRSRVEEIHPEVVPQPEPEPPTVEELQRQIQAMRAQLEAVAKPEDVKADPEKAQ